MIRLSMIVLIAILLMCGCSPTEPVSQEEKERERIEKYRSEMDGFAKSKGVIDYVIFEEDLFKDFSLNLQTKYEGTTLVFSASILDVYKSKNGYVILINDLMYDSILELKCSKETAENLAKNIEYSEFGWSGSVKFIAKIETFEKVNLEVVADGNEKDGYEVGLSDSVIMKMSGECLFYEINK
jgi:hypothetical protein